MNANVDTMCMPRPPVGISRWVTSVLRAVGTVLVAGLFTLLLVACIQEFARTHAPDALGVVIVNALFVFLYVTRSDAKAVSTSPAAWALSFAGTMLPLLMRPSPGGFTTLGNGVQLVGIAVIIVALLSLSRSFGIVPANRGVRQNGLYRFVRHPLYAGEIVFISGFVLVNPSAWNIAIWTLDCALQIGRAITEERFLSADPEYRIYCQRTRYRLVPLVF